MRIRIRLGKTELEADLFDSPIGRALAESLPLEIPFQTGGDEISFSVPISASAIDGLVLDEIRTGDLLFWPDGNSFHILLSATAFDSGKREGMSGSPVLLGRISGALPALRDSLSASTLRIEPL